MKDENFFERFCIQKLLKEIKNEDKKEILNSLIFPKSLEWFKFVEFFSIIFGGLLFGAGIIFFIAANWDSLGKFFKFFLLETLIGIFLSFWFISKNELFAKISLSISFLLFGGLLALIGQVYQTGANNWELFFYWAIFGIFWTVAAEFEFLWILWIIVSNLALFLYLNLSFSTLFFVRELTQTMGIWNTILLVFFEFANNKNLYKTKFITKKLATIATFFMTFGAVNMIFDSRALFLGIYPFWFLGMLFYFFKKDKYIVSNLILSFDIVLLALFGKWIFEKMHDSTFAFFIMSFVSITITIFTISLIKNLNKKGEKDVLL
jgi:uncharacterized membrane protein